MADEATTQEQVEAPQFPDEMSQEMFKTIVNLITQRNGLVGKVNAVKGDQQTLTEQLIESSTSKDAVAARKRRDKAKAELDQAELDLYAAIKPEVEATLADAEGSAKKIEDDIKELDGKIKPAQNFFKKMYGENLSKHLPSLERLKGFSTRGAGSSGRRVRGYTVDVTCDGETTGFDNMAGAAKYLGVETTALQEAFFSAAGNPEALKDAPDRVDFSVEYTDTYDDGSTEIKTATLVAARNASE